MRKKKNKQVEWNGFRFPGHFTKEEIEETKYLIENILKDGVSTEEIQRELDEAHNGNHRWSLLFHHLSGLGVIYEMNRVINTLVSRGYSHEEALKIWQNRIPLYNYSQ